jgi:hypothetical protein
MHNNVILYVYVCVCMHIYYLYTYVTLVCVCMYVTLVHYMMTMRFKHIVSPQFRQIFYTHILQGMDGTLPVYGRVGTP